MDFGTKISKANKVEKIRGGISYSQNTGKILSK